jgi:integrase
MTIELTGDVDALWVVDVTAWEHAMIGAGRSIQTVRLRSYHLRRFGRWSWRQRRRPLLEVTLDDLNDYLGAHTWAPATRRSHISSFRSFYRWARLTGRLQVEPTEHVEHVRPTRPRPHPVPEIGYREALAKARPRERIMIRLAGDCGLRRGEISLVHTDDLIEDVEGWSLIVHGKGGKIRVVPLSDTAARELRQLPAGYAFPGREGGHLSARWVGRLIKALLPRGYTAHKLRHRAATEWYAIDHDIFTVQDLLGHASPDTTRNYVKMPDSAKRRLVRKAAA